MFKAYGLYSHIRANRLRSALLIVGFVVMLIAVSASLALLVEAMSDDASLPTLISRTAADLEAIWPFAVLAAAAWFLLAFRYYERLIDFATGAGSVSRAEAPRLYALLENLCISRGVPIPRLKIIESDALNAFSCGVAEGRYSIAVTRGLITALSNEEIEAVLAHELTHIRNRDTQLMVIATIFVGIFAFLADLAFRNWNFPLGFGPRRDSSRGVAKGGALFATLIALAVLAISMGSSTVIRLALSRSREYLADAGSVELTKNPDAMIAALRKIERRATIAATPSRMQPLFIESPARVPPAGWFATHPSVDERVAALMRFAGGTQASPPSAAEALAGAQPAA